MNRDGSGDLQLRPRILSQHWGMSRTPVREAIARLEHEGVVRIVPRRGAFLVHKPKAELLDTFTVWAALESAAARLVAQRATDSQLLHLHKLASCRDRQRGANSDPFNRCLRFHRAIFALCACPRLIELAEGLLFQVDLAGQRSQLGARWSAGLVREQERLVQALCDGHDEMSARLAREHILGLRARFERTPELAPAESHSRQHAVSLETAL